MGRRYERLAAALEYARHGWALLPLREDKRPNWPLLPLGRNGRPEWKPLARRPATEAGIREWFRKDPNTNIGVICGEASDGLVVADFDEAIPEGWHVPITPRAVTGRGEHIYLRSGSATTRNIVYKGRKIGDLKGEGCYVVVPPSRHASGRLYEWAELLSPKELDWTLADAPDWATSKGDALDLQQRPELASSNISTCLPLGMRGEELANWDSCEEFLAAAAKLVGIPADKATGDGIGKAFKCVLPGHEENDPSASLYRIPAGPGESGRIVYRDWHRRDDEKHYTLAEVYASQHYGRAVKLRRPEEATWKLRLLVETGCLEPAPVELPPLERPTGKALRKVYEGFKLLLGCKWLHTAGAATAFSWRFAAAWCGISQQHAARALRKLLELGLIVHAGQQQCRGRSLRLYLPGRTSGSKSGCSSVRRSRRRSQKG